MTKYILHGGATGNKTDDNKNFFFKATDGLSDPVNVLCIYYAKEEKEKWADLFVEDKINFSSASPQKVLNFVMADDKTSAFTEQLKSADVIYLRGGNTHVLQDYLEKVDDLENLWRDKVVAGSSAGALVLSKYYYENDDDTFNKGLGILPIKTFCHYTEEKSDKLEKLKKYGEELKIYAISEGKFFIIEE